MNLIANKAVAGLWLAMLCVAFGAGAQERKAYRQVDSAGNVTYSQTPPVDGKAAKKVETVDIAPAQQGRGGSSGGYSSQEYRQYSGAHSPDRATVMSVQKIPSAQEQKQATLKADCERNRGTDCDNPATLRYLDSTSIPGGRRRN